MWLCVAVTWIRWIHKWCNVRLFNSYLMTCQLQSCNKYDNILFTLLSIECDFTRKTTQIQVGSCGWQRVCVTTLCMCGHILFACYIKYFDVSHSSGHMYKCISAKNFRKICYWHACMSSTYILSYLYFIDTLIPSKLFEAIQNIYLWNNLWHKHNVYIRDVI